MPGKYFPTELHPSPGFDFLKWLLRKKQQVLKEPHPLFVSLLCPSHSAAAH